MSSEAPRDHVLRLRRTDLDHEYFLVNVSRLNSKALDLKLVASEGEHVYPFSLKEANVKFLQASNYSGDLEEWKATLRYALLQERPGGLSPEYLKGVETVGAITDATLTIVIRKNISGITQRLGTIKLQEDDEEAFEPFDIAHTAASTADTLREQLEELQTSVAQQREQVAKLNQQLDDLVQAKKEHEQELLQKFAALLNAKKLKIRDQQRLLAGAKVDEKAARGVNATREANGPSSGRGRKPVASRTSKRKANGNAEPEPEPEAADEDETSTEDDELAPAQETPEHSDREETEDEEEGLAKGPTASQATRAREKAQSESSSGTRGKDLRASPRKGKQSEAMEVEEAGPPPPKRELPFNKKKPTPPPPKPVLDDDDETDDDEL